MSTAMGRGGRSGPRAGAFFALGLACAVLAPGLRADGAASGPRVHVVNPVIDLGSVAVGSMAEATFELENRGDDVLRVVSADTGCACTVVDYDEEIPPGQVGTVRAALITAQLSGSVTKGVIVHTNDPRGSNLRLTIKARVVGGVALLPNPVIMMRRREGDRAVGRLLVRQQPEAKGTLTISELTPSEPWLAARAERLDAPRPRGGGIPAGRAGDWLVEVRFRDDVPLYGPQSSLLSFRTGLARQPEIVVDVESNFDAPVRFSTGKLLLAPSRSGDLRGTLFASVREGLDPTALVAETRPDGLVARIEPATGRMVQVEVIWNGGRLEGGAVTLRVGGESVSVPVETPGS